MKTGSLKIRTKKLGALLRDARLSVGKSPEDCARILGLSSAAYTAYELGEQSPSLPELELLAYFLDIPLDHFWGDVSRAESGSAAEKLDRARLLALRQRMIGARLREARLAEGLNLEEAALAAGLGADQLAAYELGKEAVPLPVLETLGELLKQPVRAFQDQAGPVGIWSARQRAVKGFQQLSPELQAFVARPVNRPYLELAQRLSEMSVERLRAVAEGLLEITL